jgi:hypothetical protein
MVLSFQKGKLQDQAQLGDMEGLDSSGMLRNAQKNHWIVETL